MSNEALTDAELVNEYIGPFDCDRFIAERHANGLLYSVRDVASAIRRALASLPGWISVEERLPEPETDVLCFRERGSAIYPPVVAARFDDDWYTFDTPDWPVKRGQVSHWMPLPAPPEAIKP